MRKIWAINNIIEFFKIYFPLYVKMNLWHLLFIIFFNIFVIDSGKIRPNFDQIFGDGWNKKESEQTVKIEQSELNENSQSAAVDQMGEEIGTDPIDQMSECPNQNVIKSDQNTNKEPNDQQKRDIVHKFDAIKEKLKEKRKYENKNQSKIETKIGQLLGTNRILIQKWKNELNLNKIKIKKSFYEQKKLKFIERFDEFKDLNKCKKKEFVKEFGISKTTFWKWRKELMPKYHKSQKYHTNDEKFEKMKQYLEIKEANPKMSDEIIAKKLGIGLATLQRWKKRNVLEPFDQ